MPSTTFSALFRELPFERTGALSSDPVISAITADSRQVQPGALFVAMPGDSADGHKFIPDAVARGAAAVVGSQALEGLPIPYIRVENPRQALAYLAAAFHDFPARKLTVLGVTGTDGKTTTSNLLYNILLAAGLRTGMISTVNAVIGGEVLDTGFHVTTPDAPDVQRYLARMAAAGLTHVVLETTSHGWAQFRVDACEFDLGVVTNITHEHLDYHGSYENYRAAKARLFQSLAETRPKPQGNPRLAVLNRDDVSYEFLSSIVRGLSSVQPIDYGLGQGADIRAEDIRYDPAGIHFTAVGQSFRVAIECKLVGAFNVSNCLAALTAAVCGLGIAPEVAARGLASLEGVPGRMERIDLGQPFTAIVDFAHTPNALKRALEAAREMLNVEPRSFEGREESFKGTSRSSLLRGSLASEDKPRIIVAFGSAGLRDREKRRLMAEVSAELADLTVLTAEDPRTESLDSILEEMARGAEARGGVEKETFWRVPDRGEAIRFMLKLARPGDIVLACGKGHEQSMCFGATEYPWDDRTAMRAALSEYLGVPGPQMPCLPTQERKEE